MFKSKRRAIIIPQSEHARLAGTLAFLWGNESFTRPPVPFGSFVNGVELHDRCFGFMDVFSIGDIADDVWITLEKEKGIRPELADPVATILIQLHIKRLAEHRATPERKRLAEEIEQLVAENLSKLDFTRADFERADRIVDLCDSVAFDFPFEEPVTRTVQVYPDQISSEKTEIEYRILDQGIIELYPWPLSVPEYLGYIMGYHSAGYPERAEPVLVPFTVRKKR